MTIEDIEEMNLETNDPIELKILPDRIDEKNKGVREEYRMVYYAGTQQGTTYDKLIYFPTLSEFSLSSKTNDPQGIMLSLIDTITLLKRDRKN